MLLTACMAIMTLALSAQAPTPQQTPQLELVLQLRVTLGEAYSLGDTPHGRRTVIPITGGTFEGPNIKGTIINGGADYQLADPKTNRKAAPQFEAPSDSPYAWLNNAIYVCAPDWSQQGGITLNVWRVN